MDGDGTVLNGFAIHPIYEVFADEGLVKPHEPEKLWEVHAELEEGKIDFPTFVKDTLCIAAAAVRGQQLSQASAISREFFASSNFDWFGYVEPLLTEAKDSQVDMILITAEPQFIAGGIASALRMSDCYSSRFVIDSGIFTGEVKDRDILNSDQKGDITKDLISGTDQSFAFGDSEGDIGMLELVDNPYCIKPTATLRAHALTQNWPIIEDPSQPLTQVKFQ